MYKNKNTGETRDKQPSPYRAKIVTSCSKCQRAINKGDVITWPRSGEAKGAYHQDCSDTRNSPWIEVVAEASSIPEAPAMFSCAICNEEFMSKLTLEMHVKNYHPSAIPGKPVVDMPFPEDNDPQVTTTSDTSTFIPTSKGDGLLDLISERVEAKVIDSVRNKVSGAIDALDRKVKEKLETLSIPSIIIKRNAMPDVKIDNVHKQFGEVLEFLNAGSYVYLHGSPGGHKSKLGPQLAEALGVRYGYMSLCEQTPEYVVRGCVLVDGSFYLPPFVDFLENGGLWAWEEADNSNDNLRNSLNTLLENKLVHLDNGKSFQISDKFYLMANGNTCGRGAHPAFPSRTAFDAAFAARFEFVEFEYDWQLCRHIALGLNPQSGPIVSWAEKACSWAIANQVPVVISPREVYKLAKLHVLTSISTGKLLDSMLKGLDMVSKEKLLTNFPFPTITREAN